MSIDKQPEIAGPGAASIQSVPDGTGHSTDEVFILDADQLEAEEVEEPVIEIDPAFPFGRPENIDWAQIDPAGVTLLQEVNLRSWMKSTEYCSGHPLNRPPNEVSKLYPLVTGENVYEEINRIDTAFLRGLIPDVYFRQRKQDLRQQGMTRFYLNVNVYNIEIFQEWLKFFCSVVTLATQTQLNPVVIRYNPMRPGMNYSIYWDYWTIEERDMIHTLIMNSLSQFPI